MAYFSITMQLHLQEILNLKTFSSHFLFTVPSIPAAESPQTRCVAGGGCSTLTNRLILYTQSAPPSVGPHPLYSPVCTVLLGHYGLPRCLHYSSSTRSSSSRSSSSRSFSTRSSSSRRHTQQDGSGGRPSKKKPWSREGPSHAAFLETPLTAPSSSGPLVLAAGTSHRPFRRLRGRCQIFLMTLSGKNFDSCFLGPASRFVHSLSAGQRDL